MKREGRPHGMVRTLNILAEPLNPRPDARILNKVEGPLAAGLFVKVAPKPTNHSKFTGKSGRHPATKSKDKSKGSQKTRSIGDKLSYKNLSWTVMADDRSDKIPVIGYSASKILVDLHQDDFPQDHEYDYSLDKNYDDVKVPCVLKIEEKPVAEMGVCKDDMGDDIIVHGVMDDGDDGYQGFYDISGVYTAVRNVDEGDDAWYLVGGI